MKIKKVTLDGFKSIENKVEFDFENFNGLCKITGYVGAGKTTIGEAIIFGLYGSIKGKTNNDIVNFRTNKCLVYIELESKGYNLLVKRELKRTPKSGSVSNTLFECYCNNEIIEFASKKDAQSDLETNYYDTDRLAVEMFCVISFNNFKSIMGMKTADKTNFIDQIFDFQILTDLSKLAKNESGEHNSKISDYKYTKCKYENQIETLNNIKDIVIPKPIEPIMPVVPQAPVKLDDPEPPELPDYEALNKLIESENIMKDSIKALREENTKPLLDNLKVLTERQKDALLAKTEAESLGKQAAKDYKVFESGICPTCKREVEKTLIQPLIDRLTKYRSDWQTQNKLYEGIDREIKDTNNEINKIYNEISKKIDICEEKIKKATDTINNGKNLEKVYQAQLLKNKKQDEAYQKQLENYKLVVESFNKQKENYDEQLKVYYETLKKIENESIERQEQINIINSDIDSINVKIDEETDKYNKNIELAKILSSQIKSKILKSFVPAINSNIAKYTRQLNFPFLLQFDENFDIFIINLLYQKSVSISSLSTGQTKTIDTCIILGIVDALLKKINFNITFFDELLSNADEELRDKICEILKTNLKEGQILFLISHSELKDSYFDHSIKVSNKGGSKYVIE